MKEKSNKINTDKVLSTRQLEGIRQVFMHQHQDMDGNSLDDEIDVNREMALWTSIVKKGGD